MKTIIMTVGKSLLTNRDPDLAPEDKRPWTRENIGDYTQAIKWIEKTDPTLVSAETNTLNRLNVQLDDEILLLHSDTPSGLECAKVLQLFFKQSLGQNNVYLHKLPGLNYEFKTSAPALEQMAELLQTLVEQAKGEPILAATGGFKAQTMIMALMGNSLGVPVCYTHEEFKGLIYLPYLIGSGQTQHKIRSANLPHSGIPRDKVIQVRSDQQEPNRPPQCQKVKQMLPKVPWIDKVYYDKRAYSAPDNAVKGCPQKTKDGFNILWMSLIHNDKTMAIAIDTTGRSPEQLNAAINELTERLGRLF